MGHDHSGKRIVAGLQDLPARRIVSQLDYRKFDPDATAPQALLVARRTPGRAGVAQDRQAYYGTVVAVEEPVVLDINALGKARLPAARNLCVDQHDLPDTVVTDSGDQAKVMNPPSGRIWDLRRGDADDNRTSPYGRCWRSVIISTALESNYLTASIAFVRLRLPVSSRSGRPTTHEDA